MALRAKRNEVLRTVQREAGVLALISVSFGKEAQSRPTSSRKASAGSLLTAGES
jgi:hypothetical protein